MTAALIGSTATTVRVESDVNGVQEGFSVVGLPDAAVREARIRVQSAVAAAGLRLPHGRKVVNLSPADVKKEGSAYDLPIALSSLVLARALPERPVVAMGELGLDGSVRPVASAVAAGVVARAMGHPCLVPGPLAAGVADLTGATTHPVDSLAEAVAVVRGKGPEPAQATTGVRPAPDPDLSVVRGQPLGRRALEVAAAGGHHLLLSGPPGAGKTLLASCLPGLLPDLDREERLETALVRAAAGLGPGPSTRPFRSPHHTISEAALLGGGSGSPSPGEVSLATNGVLFLDELGEFPARLLDGLRQPLEAGAVHVARRSWRATFPARFQLVAATNPCPCGHLGDRLRACRCSAPQLDRYARRLSGPLLDRIDLRVHLPAVDADAFVASPGESSAEVAGRVRAARAAQSARGLANTDLGRDELDALDFDDEASGLAHDALKRGLVGGRGYDRVRRVARTVADLDDEAVVSGAHVAEALTLRGGR